RNAPLDFPSPLTSTLPPLSWAISGGIGAPRNALMKPNPVPTALAAFSPSILALEEPPFEFARVRFDPATESRTPQLLLSLKLTSAPIFGCSFFVLEPQEPLAEPANVQPDFISNGRHVFISTVPLIPLFNKLAVGDLTTVTP